MPKIPALSLASDEPCSKKRCNAILLLSQFCDHAYAKMVEETVFSSSTNDAPYIVKISDIIANLKRSPSLTQQMDPTSLGSAPVESLMINTANHEVHLRIRETYKYYKSILLEGEAGVKSLNNGAEVLRCSHCKSGSYVAIELKQTRSADEGMSVFARCEKCKRRWRM